MPYPFSDEHAFWPFVLRCVRRPLLLLVLAAFAVAGCDRFEGLTLRNDGDSTLRVTWQLPGGRENPVFPYRSIEDSRVAPGDTAEAGKVGGPPDPEPDVIVKA